MEPGRPMLSFTLSTPTTGDDVAHLQERLLELGYNPGRPSGLFASRPSRP